MRVALFCTIFLLIGAYPILASQRNSSKNLTAKRVKRLRRASGLILGEMADTFGKDKKDKERFLDEQLGEVVEIVWKACDAKKADKKIMQEWSKGLKRHEKIFISKDGDENDKKLSLFLARLNIQKLAALSVIFPEDKFDVLKEGRNGNGVRVAFDGTFSFYHQKYKEGRCPCCKEYNDEFSRFYKKPIAKFYVSEEFLEEFPLDIVNTPHAGPLSDENMNKIMKN